MTDIVAAMTTNDERTTQVVCEHLEELRKQAAQSVRIDVAVPYFDRVAVDTLLAAMKAEARLHFTFAWPAEAGERTAICPDSLQRMLEARHQVSYVRVERRLHAKAYVFDERVALISSANLTARGLGLHKHPNLELGVLSTDGDLLDEVGAWFDQLPRHQLTAESLACLRGWVKKGGPIPASPEAELPRDRTVVEEALNRAKHGGQVKSFHHLSRGWGRNAFEVEVPGVRGVLTLRARVSDSARTRDGTEGYHFEVTPNDAHLELDGLILVPVDDQRRLRPATDVPVIFLPWDRAVGRRNNQLRLGDLRSSGRGGRRVSVERTATGWELRARTVRFDLRGCENETAAFGDYYL